MLVFYLILEYYTGIFKEFLALLSMQIFNRFTEISLSLFWH